MSNRLLEGFSGKAYRIGWDAGNGAAGPILDMLVERLPGQHFTIYTDVDGNFPNHHPDPTVEKNLADLKRLVTDKQLDFGIAFDGDGDRIGAVDGKGRVIWGDQLLMILAEPVLKGQPGATIIADVKASQSLFDRIAELGGQPLMWKTGHSLIKSKMKETGAPLAGEMSGHIFFKHRWYGFDDALYAAVRLIEAVSERQKPDRNHGRDAEDRSRRPSCASRSTKSASSRSSRKCATASRPTARRSMRPTASASAPATAGGYCALPTRRMCSWLARRRRTSPASTASSRRSTTSSRSPASSGSSRPLARPAQRPLNSRMFRQRSARKSQSYHSDQQAPLQSCASIRAQTRMLQRGVKSRGGGEQYGCAGCSPPSGEVA